MGNKSHVPFDLAVRTYSNSCAPCQLNSILGGGVVAVVGVVGVVAVVAV